MKKKLLILSFCFVLFHFLRGEEYPCAPNLPFIPDITDSSVSMKIFNPALGVNIIPENIDFYGFAFQNGENRYRRLYDPAEINAVGYQYISLRRLDEKSVVGAGIWFNRSVRQDQYRSLEKDHYNTYFAFTDTTTGNFVYSGPRLWGLYSRQITSNIKFGSTIDYSIMHGLKDRYTRCESIDTRIRAVSGFELKLNQKTHLGFSLGGFINHSKYESVKEYQDALNNIFFGYNLMASESPRLKNIKRENKKGMLQGFDLQSNKLWERLSLSFDYTQSILEGNIFTGSSSKPKKRGIWQRKEKNLRLEASMEFPFLRSVIRLFFIKNQISDWAESGKYAVTFLENNEKDFSTGISLKYNFTPYISNEISAYRGVNKVDYREFNSGFRFSEPLTRKNLRNVLKIQAGILNQFLLDVSYYDFEPLFYWNTSRFRGYRMGFGYERRFTFGKIGIVMEYNSRKPHNENRKIRNSGISFYLLK